jgi:2-polyprenyl-3-methyl-5-hydroxy-6-metoxy-1,4-benzoquinol methylase
MKRWEFGAMVELIEHLGLLVLLELEKRKRAKLLAFADSSIITSIAREGGREVRRNIRRGNFNQIIQDRSGMGLTKLAWKHYRSISFLKYLNEMIEKQQTSLTAKKSAPAKNNKVMVGTSAGIIIRQIRWSGVSPT